MEEIIMDEYMNLKSPLNESGVFVGDAQPQVVNPAIESLPTMSDYINMLRQSMQNITSGSQSSTSQGGQAITSNGTPVDLSKYQDDMRLSFPTLLKQEGVNIRVTSELRKGSITKSGHKSNHSYINQWGFSGACDIVPSDGDFNKLRQQIYSNPRIVAWLINHKIGVLEEITPDVMSKTGATGKHFHIGPDSWAIKMSSKYINYDNATVNGLLGSSSTPKDNTPSKYTGKEYTLAEVGWNVTKPFKGIKAYTIGLNTKVILTKEDLWKKDTGDPQTIKTKSSLIGEQTRLGKGTIAARHNNPCNISPRKGDFGHIGSSAAADGQNHAAYRTVVDGLASTMKLYVEKYNHKSIRTVNNGFQGFLESARKKYSEEDWKALENLRLRWITSISKSLGISPFVKLELNDKETMFSFLAAVAKHESGSTLGRGDLEAAWKLFKGGQ